MKVMFTVFGEPAGKGRPRFPGKNGKPYTPQKTVNYENLVKTTYYIQCPNKKFGDDDMLDVRIAAYYKIPKSVSKKKRQLMLDKVIRPTKKPDLDNIMKIICDSLNGLAYRDDSQIVDSMCRKFYSDTPRVVVTIQNIGGNDNDNK